MSSKSNSTGAGSVQPKDELELFIVMKKGDSIKGEKINLDGISLESFAKTSLVRLQSDEIEKKVQIPHGEGEDNSHPLIFAVKAPENPDDKASGAKYSSDKIGKVTESLWDKILMLCCVEDPERYNDPDRMVAGGVRG